MSAAVGGSVRLPPKNCFSPLAGLEAGSGGGPCPAEPARDTVRSRPRGDRLREEVFGTFRQCPTRILCQRFMGTETRRSAVRCDGNTNRGAPAGRLLRPLLRGNPSSVVFGDISGKMGHAADVEILRLLRLEVPVVVDRTRIRRPGSDGARSAPWGSAITSLKKFALLCHSAADLFPGG
jgi:hypothetical protein